MGPEIYLILGAPVGCSINSSSRVTPQAHPRKMVEDLGIWLTWLLGTERCTTNLQPAAGGIFRGQRGAESGESGDCDMCDRCVALPPAEDGGRSRKIAEDGRAGKATFTRASLFIGRAAPARPPMPEELGELGRSWAADWGAPGKHYPLF